MSGNWHEMPLEEVFDALKSSEHGLTAEEARERLARLGANALPEKNPESVFHIFARQFASPLIYVLFAAAAVVILMGQFADGLIIFGVLIFNALLGTVQEGRARNTLLALKKFTETFTTVVREGKEIIVPDTEVVRGDVVLLQEGEKGPADARVVVSRSLRLDEAALTGESVPVAKSPDPVEGEELTAASNMVFKGTHVVAGSGVALVVATGKETEMGRIAEAIAGAETEIPLQRDVRNLAKMIVLVVFSGAAILLGVGILLGQPLLQMFATVVSLTVSVIPEGLPIVMTLVLATGVWRMGKRHALVKRLAAVEALGQARVIAVDKTGTLTKNEMVVEKVYAGEALFSVEGAGYDPGGSVFVNDTPTVGTGYPELLRAAEIAALTANAHVQRTEEGLWRVAGDPTEAAMAVFAAKLGVYREALEERAPLTEEIPFDSNLKYLAIVRGKGPGAVAISGAPEVILALSSHVRRAGVSEPLSSAERKRLEETFLEMSGDGLRVVALAERGSPAELITPAHVKGLTFVAFLGLKDGLRAEVRGAMEKARAAGMRVVMVTGDHAATARAVAREAGILEEGDTILSGAEIDKMNDLRLREEVTRTSVFSRVTPEHKLRIIEAYRGNGTIVAMTGDGVNDAPSLVAADLGVAMGKIGTEVAKEAADIILLDDNFGSIVSAVEEGRSMYKTIKKVILYLFSTSAGEAFTIAGALILSLPLPLLPAQIIWLNFITDGFLTVALAMEPKEQGLLHGAFRRSERSLIDFLMARRMFLMAVPMTIGSLVLFAAYAETDMGKALTMSLTTLAVFQWFNAWNCRSERESVFTMNPLKNLWLVGGF